MFLTVILAPSDSRDIANSWAYPGLWRSIGCFALLGSLSTWSVCPIAFVVAADMRRELDPVPLLRTLALINAVTAAGVIMGIMGPVHFTPEKECYSVLIL
jgi:hypothetical protein